jgi:hypothetical protein
MALPRSPFATLRRNALLMTGAAVMGLALLSAGCASQTAQYATPYLTHGDALMPDVSQGTTPSAVAVPADPESAWSAETNADDWMNRTYVYRGGRDPKTGLAHTPL